MWIEWQQVGSEADVAGYASWHNDADTHGQFPGIGCDDAARLCSGDVAGWGEAQLPARLVLTVGKDVEGKGYSGIEAKGVGVDNLVGSIGYGG